MSWQKQYKVVGIIPGRILVPGTGIVDLSDENLPEELIRKLHDKGCPYLQRVITARELAKNIAQATSREEAMQLSAMKPESKQVQDAFEKRIKELDSPG